MVTDINGSVDYLSTHGDLEAFEAFSKAAQMISSSVVQGSGVIIKSMGPRILSMFSDEDAAMLAAAEMHAILASAEFAQAGPLSFNIAIHSGRCLAVESNGNHDYFGHTVDVLGRLGQLAVRGQCLISLDVWDKLSQETRSQFEHFAAERVRTILPASFCQVQYVALELHRLEKKIAA